MVSGRHLAAALAIAGLARSALRRQADRLSQAEAGPVSAGWRPFERLRGRALRGRAANGLWRRASSAGCDRSATRSRGRRSGYRAAASPGTSSAAPGRPIAWSSSRTWTASPARRLRTTMRRAWRCCSSWLRRSPTARACSSPVSAPRSGTRPARGCTSARCGCRGACRAAASGSRSRSTWSASGRGCTSAGSRPARTRRHERCSAPAAPTYLRDRGESDHAELTRAGVPAAWVQWREDACWHRSCDVVSRVRPRKLEAAYVLVLRAAEAALG